jgi:hypothetical protein
LQDVAINNVSVKNNRMVVDISREQILAKGIPERYYHILLQNIRDNNAYIDSIGITNVDSLVTQRNIEYFRYMQEREKTP